MIRSELEEQIRSTLGGKLSQEQIASILESIQLDDRKLKLVVTSDPRIFGGIAMNSTFFEGNVVKFRKKNSRVSAIFGDIQPGDSHDKKIYKAPEFSMDQIQVVAEQLDMEDTYSKDSSDEEEYYRHDYVIHIYIPDEKTLDSRKPRSEAEARKIKLLSDLRAGKKVQRKVSYRSDGERRNGTDYKDIELTEELEKELNGYVQKVKERTPLVSYQELIRADAKLHLMEKIALQTRGKISEEDLAVISDRIVRIVRIVGANEPEIGIEVTSNPDVFAETVVERHEGNGYYISGDYIGYDSDSYIRPVYGDLEPGYYRHYVKLNSPSKETEEKNLSDFSMNGLQIAVVIASHEDTSYGWGYYFRNDRTTIQIYIPKEVEYEIVSYKEMKETPKSLDALVMEKMREAIGGTIGKTGEIEGELTEEELNKGGESIVHGED